MVATINPCSPLPAGPKNREITMAIVKFKMAEPTRVPKVLMMCFITLSGQY
jgi:hypothetical protein